MRLGTIAGAGGEYAPAAFVEEVAVDLLAAAASAGANEAGLPSRADDPSWYAIDNRPRLQELVTAQLERQLALPLDQVCLGPPVSRPGKIIAAGRNYLDHVREGQAIWAERGRKVDRPAIPSGFIKLGSALSRHEAVIPVPDGVDGIDYEVELAVVIGKRAYRVEPGEALSFVAGYTVCNDLACRPVQFAEMEQQIGIVMGKNLPGFAPMGPWFVTPDEIGDPQDLELGLRVNGETRQHANTSDMLFGIAELVAYWSRLGLDVGDILLTGTPAGVAAARPKDQRESFYLKDGDVVEAWVSGIGTLRNRVLFEEAKR